VFRWALISTALSVALIGCGQSSRAASTTGGALSAAVQPVVEGGPRVIEISAPPAVRAAGGKRLAEFEAGRKAVAQSGCLACHEIGDSGNRGPGSDLTHVGSMLSRTRIERALVRPTEPMPSFKRLRRAKFRDIVVFLSLLRR
jgi:mono/diheme cytochrome c family protein